MAPISPPKPRFRSQTRRDRRPLVGPTARRQCLHRQCLSRQRQPSPRRRAGQRLPPTGNLIINNRQATPNPTARTNGKGRTPKRCEGNSHHRHSRTARRRKSLYSRLTRTRGWRLRTGIGTSGGTKNISVNGQKGGMRARTAIASRLTSINRSRRSETEPRLHIPTLMTRARNKAERNTATARSMATTLVRALKSTIGQFQHMAPLLLMVPRERKAG